MSIRIYRTAYVCPFWWFECGDIGGIAIWGAATSSTYHPSGRCCAINVIMFKHDDDDGGIKKNAIHCVTSACRRKLPLFVSFTFIHISFLSIYYFEANENAITLTWVWSDSAHYSNPPRSELFQSSKPKIPNRKNIHINLLSVYSIITMPAHLLYLFFISYRQYV